MKNEIIVAYVCDERYKPYLRISMDSVRRYNKNVKFVILTDKLFEIDGADVYIIEPDRKLFYFNQKDRMKDGVYYKFYLPNLPYDKILYIDCDVICQRPLKSLWEEECPFICATESHRFGQVQARMLGLKKYAITGMMLMNLKALREADFTNRCLDRLKKEQPRWHDETIINLEFNDKIRFIDKKYNYCRKRIYDSPIAESDAYLLHYVSKQKRDMLLRDNFNNLTRLKKELKGKRIAIVGNSVSLLDKGQGKEIDSHDIVIRFNKGFPSAKVGYKTDIVFLACTLDNLELNKFSDAYRVQRSKLCQNACDFKISTADRVQLAQTPNNYVKEMRGGLKSQASTGFIAINFALSCGCRSIDLYGFDFFDKPTYYNPEGYKTLHNGDKEKEKILEYKNCGLLEIK